MIDTTNNRPRPFVILSHERSGTNYLVSRLLLSTEVVVGQEPFNPEFLGYETHPDCVVPSGIFDKMNDRTFRDTDKSAYIEFCSGITGALDNTGIAASGFKIMYHYDTYWQMTLDRRFYAIVLERKSVLSVYSSMLIANQTTEWVAHNSTQTEKQVQVEFVPELYKTFKKEYRHNFHQTEKNLASVGATVLKIYYEDLITDPECFVSVINFLGISNSFTGESWMLKQNDSNVLNRFTNPQDAMPFFEAEGWEFD